ncbi:MAG: CTP synthase, partial [Phycisphaerae bacterium]
TSDDTEFYTPMPGGYKPGKTKYVIVLGSVMSGLGKGIISSSLAKLLKDKGLTVAPIKLEGYLNLDSGTLNPYRHGEVFVLDDGVECDMDLGTYERLLDQDLSRRNFATSGQIFTRVLERERMGGYLGHDVLMIPHVTGEVKLRLRELAVDTDADVVFVEIGGTVGDVENAYFIEAMRELAFEEGPDSTCFVVLTYIIEPPALGEQKSKAAQLGIRRLQECGVQPHIIACRGRREMTTRVREKLSMYTNVPIERVISIHDCESIYRIPDLLRRQGLDTAVVDILKLRERMHPEAENKALGVWAAFVDKLEHADGDVTIGIVGKYTSVRDSYASVIHALEVAGAHNGVRVRIDWIDTTPLNETNAAAAIGSLDAILLPGGFGVRGAEGKIACIRHARDNHIPFLGICYGFQLAVVEYARHVCGLAGANSREIDPECAHPVIDILPEQKAIEGLGGNMRLGGHDVAIAAGTRAAQLFNGAREVRLRFRHRWEVDPKYVDQLTQAGLVFSGKAPDYPIMQVLELPSSAHPFFVATQAHAEMTSRTLRPDPLYLGLVRAAIERRRSRAERSATALPDAMRN